MAVGPRFAIGEALEGRNDDQGQDAHGQGNRDRY